MGPKKEAPKKQVAKDAAKQKEAFKKAQGEKRAASAADKTFGLKNKNKSKVVQGFVKAVSQGVTAMSEKEKRIQAEKAQGTAKAKKEADAKLAEEMATLFGVQIKQPKTAEGVDPKSVLCEFYRHGKCTKGYKCKYSHDMKIERKTAKKSLFDEAALKEEEDALQEDEGMEDWDQTKLEEAIKQKHGNEANSNVSTTIICKHFLGAIEKKIYGWFWSCPGGKECKYKHALPPGYLMKSEMQALLAAERANLPTQEESLEIQRKELNASTPVTPDTYSDWKKKWDAKRKNDKDALKAEHRAADKISGRDLFEEFGVEHDDAHLDFFDFEASDTFEADAAAAYAKAQKANEAARAAGVTNESSSENPEDELCEADFEGMDDLDLDELAELEEGLAEASFEETQDK